MNHLGEEIKMVGNPIKMSKVKEEVFEGAPTLGQHTGEVLSGLLHYSREQVEELRKQKVL